MTVPNLIPVLDKGYVRLIDVMGDDLTVVNAARASFAKESKALTDRDRRLIRYLWEHGHTSPFRHAFLSFEVKAPLMVARQWWRYIVGSDHVMDAWNEASRRYITLEPEFYVPTEWRAAPENRKHGSGGPLPGGISGELSEELLRIIEAGLAAYNHALELGVAPEQARLFLPAYGMYTVWRWSASLQSVLHFLSQRLAEDAQVEIREYARAVYTLARPHFPETFRVVFGDGGDCDA